MLRNYCPPINIHKYVFSQNKSKPLFLAECFFWMIYKWNYYFFPLFAIFLTIGAPDYNMSYKPNSIITHIYFIWKYLMKIKSHTEAELSLTHSEAVKLNFGCVWKGYSWREEKEENWQCSSRLCSPIWVWMALAWI